ncbi:MAG: hypothetical protein Q7W30_03230 [Coriobacteriia bacterium]|nr:hypothetical protein [Coriobacteriia bacterium]
MSELLEPQGSGEEYTTDQMARLLDLYEHALDERGYTPVPYPEYTSRVGSSIVTASRFDCLNHAFWMCGCIRRFVREHRNARAYRWLGMVQGLLFMGGMFSLDELLEQERALPGKAAKRVRDTLDDGCPPPA